VTGLTGTHTNAFASNGTNLFAGTSTGIFLSTNLGTTWTTVDSGLTDTYVNALTSSGTILFAATASGGVFYSASFGKWWGANDSGMAYTSVGALAVSGTILFAGTSGSGVWRFPLLVEGVPSEKIPTGFRLQQNYPNPFNPSTTISFDLPTSGLVRLKIFDLLGRSAATLIQEFEFPGHHVVEFKGTGMSSGVYFYELQFGSSTIVRRMTLIR
jgi:hypothetical protein